MGWKITNRHRGLLRSFNINENWIKARTFSVPKLKFLRLIGHIILRSMDGPCGISRYHITKHAHPIQILKAFELNRYINNMFKRAKRKNSRFHFDVFSSKERKNIVTIHEQLYTSWKSHYSKRNFWCNVSI